VEEEEEVKASKITYKGVTYYKSEGEDNIIYDEEYEEVGVWNNETKSIDFTEEE
jgi:hypothetical protein